MEGCIYKDDLRAKLTALLAAAGEAQGADVEMEAAADVESFAAAAPSTAPALASAGGAEAAGGAAAAAEDPELQLVETMSARELMAAIVRQGGRCDDCFEKVDLRARLVELINTPVTSNPATTSSGSNSSGSEREAASASAGERATAASGGMGAAEAGARSSPLEEVFVPVRDATEVEVAGPRPYFNASNSCGWLEEDTLFVWAREDMEKAEQRGSVAS